MCQKIYSSGISPADRAEHVFNCDPDGCCQMCKVTEHSPGPVFDKEFLARSIDFPLRQQPEGDINDSLFQDAFSFGASTQRVKGEWTTASAEIHARYEQRANLRRTGADNRTANPEWQYIGAVLISVKELRDLQLQTNGIHIAGIVRVYDAAHSADDPYHADIFAKSNGLAKVERKLLRVKLMTMATKGGIYLSPHLNPKDPCLENISVQKISLSTGSPAFIQ